MTLRLVLLLWVFVFHCVVVVERGEVEMGQVVNETLSQIVVSVPIVEHL